MFRALEHMNIRGPDGHPLDLAPGDEVPGFGEWPQWTQHAMVGERRVRWAPEGLTPPELARARQIQVLNADTPLAAAPVAPVVPAAPAVTPTAEPAKPLAQIPSSQAPDAELQCDVCQRRGFKSLHGLKIHQKQAHK